MKFLKTISTGSNVILVDSLKSTKVEIVLKIFGIYEAIGKQTRDYDEKWFDKNQFIILFLKRISYHLLECTARRSNFNYSGQRYVERASRVFK